MPRRSDTDPKALAKDREAALRLVPLSDTEQQRLLIYQDLILRWHGMLNLVSASTVPKLWTRHIAEFGATPGSGAERTALGRFW